tara:strand:+ start:313 stop:534 length:222 start_codon:yes stop_codon:yes gene_type:complete
MSFTSKYTGKGKVHNKAERCPPCKGYCKVGGVCIERERAMRILNAVAEERADQISDEQILWALCVTGDIPVAE